MHNLEQLIAEWRKTMMAVPNVGSETLDELELSEAQFEPELSLLNQLAILQPLLLPLLEP